jgi:hypothetical protein
VNNLPALSNMSAEQLSSAIDKLKSANTKQLQAIQLLAVQTTVHAINYGDVTLCSKLVDALGKGLRRDSLVKWYLTEGVCTIVESTTDDGKKIKSFVLNKDRRGAMTALIKSEGLPRVAGRLMREVPWFEAKKETKPYEGFDLTKLAYALLARAEKVSKDESKASADGTDLSFLPILRAALSEQGHPST